MFCTRQLCWLCHRSHSYAKFAAIHSKLGKYYSSDEKGRNEAKPRVSLPPLMVFKPRAMPNFFRAIKCDFLVNFFVRPFIDPEFDMKSFLDGAKQAMCVVSANLANDNIAAIEGLVTRQAYEEIKKSYSTLTTEQKQELRVNKEDIFYCFIYDISVTREDEYKYAIEILVVFDCVRQMEDLLKEDFSNLNFSFNTFEKYFERKYLCNYGFIRKYVKGKEHNWIINKLLHIKDRDIYNSFRKNF